MKYTAEEARKQPVFKLLWAMVDDIDNQNPMRKDATGTIISWYASIIEERAAKPKEDKQ